MKVLSRLSIFLLFVGLLGVLQIEAQNRPIDFKHISFKEALEQAKAQDKLVFIDCFIDGCKPCKLMAKTVFMQDKVGDFMNHSFVSLKMNMYKGEGPDLIKKYGVFAYPTYLFIDSDGNLRNKFVGGMEADAFIAKAKLSLDEDSPFLLMTKKYESGHYNHAFMRDYIKMKFELCEYSEAIELANKYFHELSAQEKPKAENWFLYGSSPMSSRIAYPDSPECNYLVENWKDFKGEVPDSVIYSKINENFREITRKVFNGSYFSTKERNPDTFESFKQKINQIEFFPQKKECMVMMDVAKAVCLNDTMLVQSLMANNIADFSGQSQTILLDYFAVYLNQKYQNSSLAYEIRRQAILSNKNEKLIDFLKLALEGNDPKFEKYDAENLKNKFDQKSIVPFFHPQLPLCYFAYTPADQKSRFISFDAKNSTNEIINKKEVDSVMLSLNIDTSYVTFYPGYNQEGLVVNVNTSSKNYTYLPKEKKIEEAAIKEFTPVQWGLSPDKKYEVYGDGNNLFIRNLKDSTETQLTTDGNGDAMYQLANLKWISDKGKFIVYRNDNRGVREITVINSAFKPYPLVKNYKDALPGDEKFSTNLLYLGDVKSKTIKQIDVEHWKGQEVFPITRSDNSELFYFTRLKRTHDEIELCSVNDKGEVNTIIHEKCIPNFNDMMFSCKILNKGKDILFWSDRTGWGHYYRYDKNGKLLNTISSGDWTAGAIAKFDEENQQVYFYGYGKNKKMNPNYAFLYKVNMNGSNLTLLTPENANHKVYIHEKGNLIIDNYSRIDTAPLIVARDCNGNFVDTVMKPDIQPLLDYGWNLPEQFTVKAADNSTDLYGIMWKPFDFDPNKKYPIISQVYPGPFTETVWTDFTVLDKYHNAALAQRGFIVVCFGHRGSSPIRNKAYASYGFGNLRDYPLADDKYGIEQLARRYSFIDSTRVGILGHSGGAFMAVTAMCTYPDFYKVAVASSGNYDNTIYHKNWGEYYQGIGEDLQFKVKSPMELASNLKGKLLLVTGESDINVNPSNTYRMVDSLINADKDFDLLVLPGQEHHYLGVYNNYFERRKRDYFTKYLK